MYSRSVNLVAPQEITLFMVGSFENKIIDGKKKIIDLKQLSNKDIIFKTISKDAATNMSLALCLTKDLFNYSKFSVKK